MNVPALARLPAGTITAARSAELLAVARQALESAETVPEIDGIADMAEAVRYAAKLAGLGIASINNWTLLKVHAERRGAEKIKALRAAGLLAEKGGDRRSKSGERTLKLPDLIESRAKQRAADWAKLAELSDAEIAAEAERANRAGKELSTSALAKLGVTKRARTRRAASRAAVQLPNACQLRIGDCRSVLADVPDNSAALILTDPPYTDAADPLWQWLADFAARALIPGGSLVCYAGQFHLPRRMQILAARLTWWWLLSMPHHQARRYPSHGVICTCKPALWLTKGPRRSPRSLLTDTLASPKRDKSLHDWAQGEGGVPAIIEQLTVPGELIVDPFAGSARWGEIAAGMGRRWLGADIIEGGATAVVADVAG